MMVNVNKMKIEKWAELRSHYLETEMAVVLLSSIEDYMPKDMLGFSKQFSLLKNYWLN